MFFWGFFARKLRLTMYGKHTLFHPLSLPLKHTHTHTHIQYAHIWQSNDDPVLGEDERAVSLLV